MNVFITGASNGIGYETALLFAKQEDTKIFAVSRDSRKLLALQQAAIHENPQALVHTMPLDLENFKEEDLLSALRQNNFSAIDVLINNAGRLISKPFEQLTHDDWMSVYNVNVFGAVKTIKTLLPLMGKNSRAHIVNISSFGGFQGSAKFAGLSAYSSSKAALVNITECLAEEFKDKNISVNCLALGSVQTGMLAQAFPGHKAPVSAARIAEFIVHFAATGHRYFNGKILPVTLSAT